MKLITKLSMVLVLTIISTQTYSQDCNFYIPLAENTGVIYKNYDANDNFQGRQETKITKVDTHSDHTEAWINSKQFDDNNNLLYEGDFGVKCIGEEIVIDIQSILDPSMMEGFEGMEVRMEANDIVLPAKLSVGQKLPDAKANIKVVAGGMTVTELDFLLKDRKVLSKEKVSVPAGNFDTYKISYDYIIETKAMGMLNKMTFKHIEYNATDIGMVKSETFDSEGEMMGYTVLSEIL